MSYRRDDSLITPFVVGVIQHEANSCKSTKELHVSLKINERRNLLKNQI
jgi:hypothetical protein